MTHSRSVVRQLSQTKTSELARPSLQARSRYREQTRATTRQTPPLQAQPISLGVLSPSPLRALTRSTTAPPQQLSPLATTESLATPLPIPLLPPTARRQSEMQRPFPPPESHCREQTRAITRQTRRLQVRPTSLRDR